MLRLISRESLIVHNLVPFGTSNKDKKKKAGKTNGKYTTAKLPAIQNITPEEKHPVKLPGVSFDLASKVINYSNKTEMTVNDYLLKYLKHFTPRNTVPPQPMVSANVGKTKVTTLIDGEQIFDKTLEYVKGAKKSIQLEMFELQNLKVNGDIWPSNGAESVPGWEQQQQLVGLLINKKKENPNLKVQVLLDAHKWYMDGNGNYKRHYNNAKMMKHLHDNGIAVLPYPRAAQQGATLQHVKLLAVDGDKAIIGGMNWGTHSTANHDVCVSIEPQKNKLYRSSEVDNIIDDIFNKDWEFSKQRLIKTKPVSGPLSEEEQENYTRLNKKIKPENVEYMNIVGHVFANDDFKDLIKSEKEFMNDEKISQDELDKLKNLSKAGKIQSKEENLSLEDYDRRYKLLKLIKKREEYNLPEVHPVKNPAIRTLTNKPREMSYIGEEGSESIGNYLKEKVKTTDKLRAELFVLSHKEIVNTIIDRHKKTQKGEDDLDVKILVSPDILEAFPYTRKFYQQLVDSDVPVREFKCEEDVNQRLHTKLGIFEEKGKKEVILGSANWSAVGLEQNLQKGTREDYYLTVKYINKEIKKYLKEVEPFEKKLGLKPLGKNYTRETLMLRKKVLKPKLVELKKDGYATIHPMGDADIKGELKLDSKDTKTLSDVYGYYKLIQDYNNKKEKYKRGNNECAIVFESPKIANNFLKQFDKDWKHSKSRYEKLVKTGLPSVPKGDNVIELEPKTDFENKIVLATKGKQYQGAGLYNPDGFINWKKVGWEQLKKEPFNWEEKDKLKMKNNLQAYWHALSLAETNDTTWVRRYNKYNVLKPLATNHTLASREAKELYADNLKVLLDKNRLKKLDVPICDEKGRLKIDFTVFDFESTGVDPKKDKIVQIGAIKVKNGQIDPKSALDQLVNPEMPIPEGASKVHRIYDHHVKNAPHVNEVLQPFSEDYLGNGILVAYNSKYDITMLNKNIDDYNGKLDKDLEKKRTYRVLDPFIMVQRIHPYLGARKRLSEQYKFLFGQDLEGAHDAFADVKATVDVLKYCTYTLNERRVDKSKPLTVRDMLLFQNGKMPENLDFRFDANEANADVNFDASYRKVSLSVDDFFDGYKLTKETLKDIKPEIGNENFVALANGQVTDELVNLTSERYPINPKETLTDVSSKHGAVNANYVMKKNYKEMLDLVGVKAYKDKSKEQMIDYITQKAEHYIKEAPVTIWMKNPKLYDVKEGNDLPDYRISRKVMLENLDMQKKQGKINPKGLKDVS